MNETNTQTNDRHLMLDIEALGLRPGCAVIQIAAQYFDPYEGTSGPAFNIHIKAQSPFTIDPATLEWHCEKGTFPRMVETEALAVPPVLAIFALNQFIRAHGKPGVWWAWGATYDFTILGAVYEQYNQETPWEYWQAQCARTVFKTLLPLATPEEKPHDAAQDVAVQIKDLTRAFHVLKN